MGISFRHYLFPEQGDPLRVSQRVMSGMIFGKDAMPAYAGTRMKAMTVILANEDGKPTEAYKIEASIFVFDNDGKIHEGLSDALRHAMETMSYAVEDEVKGGTVVDLKTRRSRQRLEREYRWKPTKEQIDRVLADIWPPEGAQPLALAAGVAPRRPSLTYEGNSAIKECSEKFFGMYHAIERLKEPSLKGFVFEASKRADDDPDFGPLYRAISEMAQHRLDLIRRRRVQKGVWYAAVDVIRWNDGIGHTLVQHHRQCQGKKAAISEARKMLLEHASMFDDGITVEAEILTDLEWRDRRIGEDDSN